MKLVLSHLPIKAISITAGIILSLGVIVSLVNDALLYQSEKELLANKISVTKLQAQITTIKQGLENQRQNLQTQLRKTKLKNNTILQYNLERLLELSERHVFNSPDISDLKIYETITENILRENNYQNAIPELTKIKEGYQFLVNILNGNNNGLDIQCSNSTQTPQFSQQIDTSTKPRATTSAAENSSEQKFIKTYPDAICYFNHLEKVATYLHKYAGEMSIIPAGHFEMGSDNGDSNEKPVHTVHISSFKLMTKEVTFKQYDSYAKVTGKTLPKDEGWGRGNRPVINVNWHESRDYADWLSKKTGHRFRLPTEAEWEYAARAGSTGKYSWGNDINCTQARYGNDNGNCGNEHKTVPVGSYQPNSFGLYDMHGNVLEWVYDCWNDNYRGAPINGKAWIKGDCEKRGFRGGAWFYSPQYIRSASRNWSYAAHQFFYFGFRLVRE